MPEFSTVGKSVPKIDALSLATGREKYADDFEPENPLRTALLTSPHAHGEIIDIDTREAFKTDGVVDILTFMNVPRIWHTTAGQGYPEPSPYDALLFARRVRFVGDRVALVAAETMEGVPEGFTIVNFYDGTIRTATNTGYLQNMIVRVVPTTE